MGFRQIARLVLLTVFLALHSGCALWQKPSVAPRPAANWATIPGQVRYRDAHRAIIADVTLRKGSSAREFSLEVNKAGLILLQLDRAETVGWARGPLAHRPFSGLVDSAPPHLREWFQETTAALEKSRPAPGTGIQFRLER